MSTFYICEPGIRLWEQSIYTTAPGIITFSFLGPYILEVWATWSKVTNSLEQHKIQEVRLRKEIEKTLTDEDLIKKNETSKIYSYIQSSNSLDNKLEPNELTQHRNTILIFKKSTPNLNLIWEQLSKADKGITSQNIFDLLTNSRETLIGRFIESDTHSAAQLIAPIEYSDKIKSLIEMLDTIKTTKTEIPDIIQSF
jgi:hypothetical protein